MVALPSFDLFCQEIEEPLGLVYGEPIELRKFVIPPSDVQYAFDEFIWKALTNNAGRISRHDSKWFNVFRNDALGTDDRAISDRYSSA